MCQVFLPFILQLYIITDNTLHTGFQPVMASDQPVSYSCCEHAHSSSVNQTLDEMDFERGVWSAALNGELDKVCKYLNTGGDPNARDSSGYTALVSNLLKPYILYFVLVELAKQSGTTLG